MDTAGPLQDLIALAQEPSSARRRELLRRVTDLFLSTPAEGKPSESFDAVLCPLADEVEVEVRAELSRRFARAPHAPAGLAAKLARDCIEVALPILSNANLLTEADLVDVARTQGQAHLRAVSARPGLSEAVSDVIVERGDDETLGILVANDTAALSRQASEAVVARAANPALQAATVNRASLPLDLLNEMYLLVEERLRERIRARNAAADPAALDAALKLARARLTARAAHDEGDLRAAEAEVESLARRARLTPAALLGFLRSGSKDRFIAGLARLAEVDSATVQLVVDRNDFDALAVVCKAADIDKSMFLTFAVINYGGRDAMSRAAGFGRLYAELPRDTAQRTLRFWRIRCEAEDAIAA